MDIEMKNMLNSETGNADIKGNLPLNPKEAKNINNIIDIKSIHRAEDRFIIKDEPALKIKSDEMFPATPLSGVCLEGIQYYDLKNIQFINNSGMAELIDLLKSLLKQGVEVKFMNVNKKLRSQIKALGLDHILICS